MLKVNHLLVSFATNKFGMTMASSPTMKWEAKFCMLKIVNVVGSFTKMRLTPVLKHDGKKDEET